MIVEVYFTPDEFAPDAVAGKVAVVVDILRASTVSAIALQNGAAEIYPVDSLAGAERLADRLAAKKPLLCGEREGKMVPGYDLGNSPLEYTPEKIAGRTLIHCSTNGTVAMAATGPAPHRFMAGLVNGRAAVEEIARTGLDVVVICGGQEGALSLEDAFGGGRVIALLTEYFPEVRLGNDHAATAEYIYAKNQHEPLALLQDCSHGRYLAQLGFAQDLEICAGIDTVPQVARMAGERLVSTHPTSNQ